jgi:hypothetical protein
VIFITIVPTLAPVKKKSKIVILSPMKAISPSTHLRSAVHSRTRHNIFMRFEYVHTIARCRIPHTCRIVLTASDQHASFRAEHNASYTIRVPIQCVYWLCGVHIERMQLAIIAAGKREIIG